MAFLRTNLYPMSAGVGSGAPKLFTHIDSGSTKAQIATADYLLTAYELFNVGDFILAHGSDGGVVLCVTAATSATVTVEEATLA